MFDPEAFGAAMGDLIREAVEPLHKEISDLKSQLAAIPKTAGKDGADGKDGRDGADVDMVQVKAMIEDAVRAIPAPKDGKDGADGKDGRDGSDGKDGERGEKGADGLGVADLMIDRDGALVATMTDGRIKSLGPVVGKDGRDGQDGKDGVGLDAFELEYLDETHEVRIKAACGGRVKEIRYPAGGIRPGGYWREGIKAKSGEVWVEGGTSYVCNVDTTTKPEVKSADWTILARKGRDGETTVKTVREGPTPPIKLNPFPQADPHQKL